MAKRSRKQAVKKAKRANKKKNQVEQCRIDSISTLPVPIAIAAEPASVTLPINQEYQNRSEGLNQEKQKEDVVHLVTHEESYTGSEPSSLPQDDMNETLPDTCQSAVYINSYHINQVHFILDLILTHGIQAAVDYIQSAMYDILSRGKDVCVLMHTRHLTGYCPNPDPVAYPASDARIRITKPDHQTVPMPHNLSWELWVQHANRLAYSIDVLNILGIYAFEDYLRALLYTPRWGVHLEKANHSRPPSGYATPFFDLPLPLITSWDLYQWQQDRGWCVDPVTGYIRHTIKHAPYWQLKFSIRL